MLLIFMNVISSYKQMSKCQIFCFLYHMFKELYALKKCYK